jgi:hypothetical protein
MTPEDHPGPAIGLTGARFGGAPRRKAERHRGRDAGSRGTAAADAVTEAIPAVPAAGADGAGAVAPASDPDADGPGIGGGAPAVGLTGARFGGAPRRRRRPVPTAPEPGVADPGLDPAVAPAPDDPFADPEPVDPSASSFVRPYVLTGGRTRSRFELAVETLVSAVPMAVRDPEPGEHRAVVDLCREPRSVAEVAALLGVPLGVARVWLGDLAATGAVAVHRSAGAAGPDMALMERVLTGLHRL